MSVVADSLQDSDKWRSPRDWDGAGASQGCRDADLAVPLLRQGCGHPALCAAACPPQCSSALPEAGGMLKAWSLEAVSPLRESGSSYFPGVAGSQPEPSP